MATLAASACLAGCSGFEDHRAALNALHAQGRYESAASVLSLPETEAMYGDHSRLLLWLDRGAVALARHDAQGCLENLERAEAYIEAAHGSDPAGDAARWLMNDTAAAYLGEPYEDLYINVLKLLAQLESGHVQGGATVEARRLASKADTLRDRHVRYRDAALKKGGDDYTSALESISSAGLVSSAEAGRFIESTLGTYLTAVTFMHSGETEFQRVAGRRLRDSIRLQGSLIGPVRAEAFAGLGERPAAGSGRGDVLVVALSGRGPTKFPRTIGPIPVFDWPVYFQLPVLAGGCAEAQRARLILAEEPRMGITGDPSALPGGTVGQFTLCTAIEMELVEDMASVATANHERELPLIYARTLLRSSAKAGLSFAVTQSVRRRDRDGWATLASVLGGLAAVALTEKADLRCWAFLPGRAYVALSDVKPGRYLVRIEYLAASGGVLHTTSWQTADVQAGGLTTIVEHFWR
ncbi:MAG: hypothetical protein JNM07_02740 [Phycisphaerae bacterium]|nr:hypothetical protein [Phycisphaerae bacterium]